MQINKTFSELTKQFTKFRFRHCFIIGQTQTGKSNTMIQFVLQDIENNAGIFYLDLDGDDTDTIISRIPKRRLKDVIFVDFGDTDHPIAWNPLEGHFGDYRATVAELFVDTLSSLWGYEDVTTPDMDRTIYNTAMALIDHPTGTIVGMYNFLTSKAFRKRAIAHIKDPVIKDYWEQQFSDMNKKDQDALTKSTVNKLERFVADPRIRNTLGQSKSVFDLEKAIKERKIMIVKIPQAQYGLSKSKTVGGLILAQLMLIIQQRRSAVPFHVYLPNCHYFAGYTLTQMLALAGKSSVSLTMCSQYLSQLNQKLQDAIFGNVGNWIMYRVGLTDALLLEELFEWDNTRKFLYELEMFEARTLNPVGSPAEIKMIKLPTVPTKGAKQAVAKQARFFYGSDRSKVERIANGLF